MKKISLGFDEKFFDEESKQNTPARIRRMHKELERWRNWELTEDKLFYMKGYNDLVIVKDIPFVSFCQHHLREFSGVVHVAYLAKDYIVGLSKIARVVRKFSSKPQLQEKLTYEIADYLFKKIKKCKGVMVIVVAEHNCMKHRGVLSAGKIITSAVRGDIPKDEVLRLLGVC